MPFDQVPDAIQGLLNTLNAGIDKIKAGKKNAPHPLLLAFKFHLDYHTIHPFIDGNGRTARLLTNLIVVACGYPPFWVSERGEKDAYNRYLADVQAYGGDPDLLYAFMADLVLRSLRLTADAVKGKNIEDTEDWLKELQRLKSQLSVADHVKLGRSIETVSDIFVQSIQPCIAQVIEKLGEVDELFVEKVWYFGDESTTVKINTLDEIYNIFIKNSRYSMSTIVCPVADERVNLSPLLPS